MTELVKTRIRLYEDYIKELSTFEPELTKYSSEQIVGWAEDYMAKAIWVDIYKTADIVGFFIIGTSADNCHPDCDYYISQAYLDPAYRKQGLMTSTAVDFIDEHQGLYGYDVLKDNQYADFYWKKMFKSVGGRPIDLDRVRSREIENKVNVYGFYIPHLKSTRA